MLAAAAATAGSANGSAYPGWLTSLMNGLALAEDGRHPRIQPFARLQPPSEDANKVSGCPCDGRAALTASESPPLVSAAPKAARPARVGRISSIFLSTCALLWVPIAS